MGAVLFLIVGVLLLCVTLRIVIEAIEYRNRPISLNFTGIFAHDDVWGGVFIGTLIIGIVFVIIGCVIVARKKRANNKDED